MVAGPPRSVPVPPVVVELARGRSFRAIWENELGGLTFEIGEAAQRCFLKWAPLHAVGLDLAAEAARLRWAGAFRPVPRVVDEGSDDDGSWIVTEALGGTSAVDDRWKAQPARAVAAIGAGLRAFHDSLPVADCPFSWSAEDRLAAARQRAAAGRINPSGWDEPAHRALGLDGALRRLDDAPPIDELVVCHGDACSPNTLIDDTGRCSGHVDLGSLGVADRWADLAIATWSTNWNYGPGWETALLQAYGVEPDPERTSYYRL
ncbi:MAG TPA: aminoglycoside 3'-phosphotransferase, partial [Acidimicrobiia bacterium]|nr:aminoglycoside 3'-phosphotransferase [Acidimicrobiia bacterium]